MSLRFIDARLFRAPKHPQLLLLFIPSSAPLPKPWYKHVIQQPEKKKGAKRPIRKRNIQNYSEHLFTNADNIPCTATIAADGRVLNIAVFSPKKTHKEKPPYFVR